MSIWTSATDELQKYMAVREVERQRALAEQLEREDRKRRSERDRISDDQWQKSFGQQQKQLDATIAQRNDALKERDEAKKRVTAQHVYDTLGEGTVQPEVAQNLIDTGFGDIINERPGIPTLSTERSLPLTPGVALRVGQPSQRTTTYESEGGPKLQAQKIALQTKREAEDRDAALRRELQGNQIRSSQQIAAGQQAMTGAIAQGNMALRREMYDDKLQTAQEKKDAEIKRSVDAATGALEVIGTMKNDQWGRTLGTGLVGQVGRYLPPGAGFNAQRGRLEALLTLDNLRLMKGFGNLSNTDRQMLTSAGTIAGNKDIDDATLMAEFMRLEPVLKKVAGLDENAPMQGLSGTTGGGGVRVAPRVMSGPGWDPPKR